MQIHLRTISLHLLLICGTTGIISNNIFATLPSHDVDSCCQTELSCDSCRSCCDDSCKVYDQAELSCESCQCCCDESCKEYTPRTYTDEEINYAIEHIEELDCCCEYEEKTCDIDLEELLRNHPEVLDKFIQQSLVRIEEISANTLAIILKHNPSAAQLFIEHILQNIEKFDGCCLLALMPYDAHIIERFTNEVLKKITLIQPSMIFYMLHFNSCSINYSTTNPLLYAMAQRIECYSQYEIQDIIQRYPQSARIFMSHRICKTA